MNPNLLQIDRQLSPSQIPVDVLVVASELKQAWSILGNKGESPTLFLLALWGIETKWGEDNNIFNFNWSKNNEFHNGSGQYFTKVVSSMWLTKNHIKSLKEQPNGQLVYKDNGEGSVKITPTGEKFLTWFQPPHEYTKRVAYPTSQDGSLDFVFRIMKRYKLKDAFTENLPIWNSIKTQDCRAFCHNIRAMHLTGQNMTELVHKYCGAVRKAKIMIHGKLIDRHFEYDPTLLEWYKQQSRQLNGENDK